MNRIKTKKMKKYTIIPFFILIAGCVTSPAPNFFNGNYYMAGDNSCKKVRQISSTRVMCMDSDNRDTGYRDAMTSQQLQMYQMQQAYEMQQLNQSIQQAGQSWGNAAQTIKQQNQQYIPPQVSPIYDPRANQVRCINAGIYTNCRY